MADGIGNVWCGIVSHRMFMSTSTGYRFCKKCDYGSGWQRGKRSDNDVASVDPIAASGTFEKRQNHVR
jgi:hypothetical protein